MGDKTKRGISSTVKMNQAGHVNAKCGLCKKPAECHVTSGDQARIDCPHCGLTEWRPIEQ